MEGGEEVEDHKLVLGLVQVVGRKSETVLEVVEDRML